MSNASQLEAFVQTASEYCAWCRAEPSDEVVEARMALRLLLRLQLGVLNLYEPEDIEGVDGYDCSEEELKVVLERVNLPFDWYDSYWNPCDIEADNRTSAILSDDIADIYSDLRDGVLLYDAGYHVDAQFVFVQMFRVHWGRHATNAIRALHCWFAEGRHW